MDAQQAQAVQGIPADPAHVELCFPTVHDPSLAPEGHHVVTIDVNSQPYTLQDGRGTTSCEARADRAIAQIAEHFPTLPRSIEHRQVLTPLDLERLLGLTGGHALHGDMAPDQLLFLRPVRGYADHATPIRQPVPVRRRDAPGRRRHRRERPQRRARDRPPAPRGGA